MFPKKTILINIFYTDYKDLYTFILHTVGYEQNKKYRIVTIFYARLLFKTLSSNLQSPLYKSGIFQTR